MSLLSRFWQWLLDFITTEPVSGRRRERVPLDQRTALLREVDALRRVAAVSRSHADALRRQLVGAQERSLALEETARSLVANGHDDEARNAVRLRLENERLTAGLREVHEQAERAAQQDQSLTAQLEAETRERLEQLHQRAELEAMTLQRLELEKRRLQLTGATMTDSLEMEQSPGSVRSIGSLGSAESIGAEAASPADLAARRVTRAADEAFIEDTIAAMKREAHRGDV